MNLTDLLSDFRWWLLKLAIRLYGYEEYGKRWSMAYVEFYERDIKLRRIVAIDREQR